eukprot:gnl/MRDRNA2_/MRDRNA2_125150_c0_seq1.p1 gnl/MRDRNA2_/MRDRNA2_125150_c0~~gnl/MRDRNA2_/MRDRNA2_125150_c0_seq1.p1  ORF type:complete len:116 (-),score=7.06 gnl/MRDRNA2_/MRDRNA2_125150_c0_seq1:605-952(-)
MNDISQALPNQQEISQKHIRKCKIIVAYDQNFEDIYEVFLTCYRSAFGCNSSLSAKCKADAFLHKPDCNQTPTLFKGTITPHHTTTCITNSISTELNSGSDVLHLDADHLRCLSP